MSPLHHLGDFLRELLLQIPLGLARALFILLMAGLLVWVLTLPRHQVAPPARKVRITENLKVWAATSLLIQIVIYSLM